MMKSKTADQKTSALEIVKTNASVQKNSTQQGGVATYRFLTGRQSGQGGNSHQHTHTSKASQTCCSQSVVYCKRGFSCTELITADGGMRVGYGNCCCTAA